MKLKMKNILYICTLLIISCGGSNEEITIDKELKNIETPKEEIKFHSHDNEFYPLKESMEDLQYQINLLRAQVEEYESTLHSPTLNSELLKLIKSPLLEHEIEMENGTIIQGKIITETADQMIVQTQIGQLKIDKTYIKSIKNVDPLVPKIKFQEQKNKEKINLSNLTFSGSLFNEGGRRGDFVRVVYRLWESETKLAIIDSSFINGDITTYNNNVVSNSSLEPGNIGDYYLSINIPDSIKIAYWTKEIKFNILD